MFSILKCNSPDCDICKAPRLPPDIFEQMHHLPDPVPSGERFMSFTELYGKVSLIFFYYLDDMLIKLWDWDKKWQCTQVFEGHTHYVMQIVINPKDNNQFASASLDRTIKVRLALF